MELIYKFFIFCIQRAVEVFDANSFVLLDRLFSRRRQHSTPFTLPLCLRLNDCVIFI